MSGHSKWSSIKHQKAVTDAKRANVFTKLANAIAVAARKGTDPAMNFSLRLAIDRAKSANMPKENIERSIRRGSGTGEVAIEEIIYEAYGPAATAILIKVATDNKNRTIAGIKSILNKFGGKLATSGAVSYLFEEKGQIFAKSDKVKEEAELAIIDSGAQDYEEANGGYFVYCAPRDLDKVKSALESRNFQIEDFQIIFQPKNSIQLDEASTDKAVEILKALDDLDDVSLVSSNFS